MSNIKKLFGTRIKEIRKEKCLSQEELGERSGLHPTYIGGVERGERNISVENIEKIAVGLKINMGDLFPYSDHAESESEKEKIKNSILISIDDMNEDALSFISSIIKNLKKILK